MVSPTQGVASSGNVVMKGVISLCVLAVLVFMTFSCVEWLDAKHVMVIQYPNGDMAAFTEPGPKAQWFGTVTKYDRRAEFTFGRDKERPTLKVRFNDGGHADLTGAISWEMPIKPETLIKIQKEFASQSAVEQQLVVRAINNAVYFTGPLMSSIESAGERRAELLNYIDDQARNGVYQMRTRPEKQKDPITGVEKTVNVVEIERDKNGVILRNNVSALGAYGITFPVPLSVAEIRYDKVVEDQIKDRQNAINQVQIAIANAKRAEQDALTIAKQGEATAAKAKWDQETIKARVVTEAQQRLEIAELDKKAAEQEKQRLILLGQGESERRKLVMSADGALEKKLEALVQINANYATAIKEYKGNWVPQTVMGGANGGANGGLALVDLLTAKTARDLQLDMSIKR